MHACINAWPFATSTGKGKGRIQNQEHDRTCEWSRNSPAASRNYNNKKQGLIININIMLGSAGSSQCKHSSTALVAEICICMRAYCCPPSPRLPAVLLSRSDQRPAGRLAASRSATLPYPYFFLARHRYAADIISDPNPNPNPVPCIPHNLTIHACKCNTNHTEIGLFFFLGTYIIFCYGT